MKTVATRLIVILMAALFGSGLCWAGNGNGGSNGDGAADGSGPIHDIFAGEPFEYIDGTVVEYDDGLVLEVVKVDENGEIIFDDDGETPLTEEVTISGIGPEWYWETFGVTRPEVGDVITVIGYTVEIDGVVKNIATLITVTTDEDVVVEVPLREDDGSPVWQSTGSRAGNSADDVVLVSAAAMDDDQEAALNRIQNRMQVLEKVNNMYKKTIRNMTGQLQEVEE
ncbi:MAG: hypothetical protein MUO63_13125 [Desulfobulbaceae bacterium]|nr:hypothetical protein [Desulfobulbaceae bacterium]